MTALLEWLRALWARILFRLMPPPRATHMLKIGESAPPAAYLAYQRRNTFDMVMPNAAPDVLNAKLWADLKAVNSEVRRTVRYRFDNVDKHPGNLDYWQRPGETLSGFGDCEDIAILKRFLLRGIMNRANLLLAACVTETGAWHIVLVARTGGGCYVLDNRSSKVRSWADCGYTQWRVESSAPEIWDIVTP